MERTEKEGGEKVIRKEAKGDGDEDAEPSVVLTLEEKAGETGHHEPQRLRCTRGTVDVPPSPRSKEEDTGVLDAQSVGGHTGVVSIILFTHVGEYQDGAGAQHLNVDALGVGHPLVVSVPFELRLGHSVGVALQYALAAHRSLRALDLLYCWRVVDHYIDVFDVRRGYVVAGLAFISTRLVSHDSYNVQELLPVQRLC